MREKILSGGDVLAVSTFAEIERDRNNAIAFTAGRVKNRWAEFDVVE